MQSGGSARAWASPGSSPRGRRRAAAATTRARCKPSRPARPTPPPTPPHPTPPHPPWAEAKSRAVVLEMIGDLPEADAAPPANMLFVCKLNPVTTEEDLEIIFSRWGVKGWGVGWGVGGGDVCVMGPPRRTTSRTSSAGGGEAGAFGGVDGVRGAGPGARRRARVGARAHARARFPLLTPPKGTAAP
jgi:hypothetical protein